MTTTKNIAEVAERIVKNEVHACASMLVKRMLELDDEAGNAAVCELGDGRLFGYYESDEDSEEGEVFHEVLEHWIVSDWLGRKLLEHGEAVELDFYGVCVWGRCTSGQAIAIDGVIEDIAKSIA